MHQKVKSRLISILLILSSLSLGLILILYNLNENITFFYTPSKITEKLNGKIIRVGGLVEIGSIDVIGPGKINFNIIDEENSKLTVFFQGVLPTLFRENQGVVVKGRLEDGIFIATELLAKHDENYKPPIK